MKKLFPVLMLLSLAADAQHYKTRILSQYKWDDSADIKVVCKEYYDDKGQLTRKEFVESQSMIDPDEDAEDKGTKIFYTYKEGLLISERRYRSKEYEDTAITEHSYNDQRQLVRTVIRRHDRFAANVSKESIDKVSPDKLDTTYAENPQTGEMKQIIQTADWKWLIDTIRYQYNAANKLIGQSGEKWRKISYNESQRSSTDISYSSPSQLKGNTYFKTTSYYSPDKKLLKKVKDHYAMGKKDFNQTIEYTYTDGRLTKIHSTATSFSKSKAADAKYDNLRFDKKIFYNADGTVQREESWDPDNFKLLTTVYKYE